MSRVFTMGDCHNNFKALKQCFQRSSFNYDNDILIFLGDIYDGYPDAYECAEELLKVKNLILLNGNHDEWTYNYFTKGSLEHLHMSQGGQATVNSYQKHGIQDSHIKLLESAIPYYIDDENRLFVHGGFDTDYSIEEQTVSDLMWNRDLVNYAYQCHYTKSCDIPKKLQIFKEIYVGHTTTECYNSILPLTLCNVTMMDTGAGFNGKLTIMNVDTYDFWQSDRSDKLYGPFQGRK